MRLSLCVSHGHVLGFIGFSTFLAFLLSWLVCFFLVFSAFLAFLLSLLVFYAILSVLLSGLVCFWFLVLSFLLSWLACFFFSFLLSFPFCFLGFSTYEPSKIVVTIFKYA